jgi:antitoxin (DNA-binding transcriptional repressor) of toxin-antitoxin stability system
MGKVNAVNRGIMMKMATFRISESDAARDFAGLLARVRSGAEVVIESDAMPVAILRSPAPAGRTMEEAITLLPEDSTATMDEGFARDVEAAIATHREPLNPPSWN